MFEGLFQPMHLICIFAIALLVFGPKKLPELGKGLGEGIRALKDGMKDGIRITRQPTLRMSNDPSQENRYQELTDSELRGDTEQYLPGISAALSPSRSVFHPDFPRSWATPVGVSSSNLFPSNAG